MAAPDASPPAAAAAAAAAFCSSVLGFRCHFRFGAGVGAGCPSPADAADGKDRVDGAVSSGRGWNTCGAGGAGAVGAAAAVESLLPVPAGEDRVEFGLPPLIGIVEACDIADGVLAPLEGVRPVGALTGAGADGPAVAALIAAAVVELVDGTGVRGGNDAVVTEVPSWVCRRPWLAGVAIGREPDGVMLAEPTLDIERALSERTMVAAGRAGSS